jgi:hypothetical protein
MQVNRPPQMGERISRHEQRCLAPNTQKMALELKVSGLNGRSLFLEILQVQFPKGLDRHNLG